MIPGISSDKLLPLKKKKVTEYSSRFLKAVCATTPGWRDQEDAHCVTLKTHKKYRNMSCFAVMDGHGGPEVSRYISENLSARISRLRRLSNKEIIGMFKKLDREILAKYKHGGSTLVLALIRPSRLTTNSFFGGYEAIICSTGDSRAVVFHKSEKDEPEWRKLTYDHKPSAPSEKARIEAAGGKVSGNRIDGILGVARAFGDWQFKQNKKLPSSRQKVICDPDIVRLTLTASDALFLCSDGIFEACEFRGVLDAISGLLFESDDIKRTLHTVLECALQSGSNDNMTAIMVKFHNQQDRRRPSPRLSRKLTWRDRRRIFLKGYRRYFKSWRQEPKKKYTLTIIPQATQETYYVTNHKGHRVGVFKPHDGDPGRDGTELKVRVGVRAGEGWLKEIAAYKLDHGNWAGVPKTEKRRLEIPGQGLKYGSLQRYVEHLRTAGDICSSRIPRDEVHRIGVLDIRIMNLDRHLENLLIAEENFGGEADDLFKLVPIDHALSLPDWRSLTRRTETSDSRASYMPFAWMEWEQSNSPFSKDTRRYIRSLNPIMDFYSLLTSGIRFECALTNLIATSFLKTAARKGYNLFQIGSMTEPGEGSALEWIVNHFKKTLKEVPKAGDGTSTSSRLRWKIVMGFPAAIASFFDARL